MKYQILLLGALFCLGSAAPAQTTSQTTKSTESANRMKRAAIPEGQQSVTGCVDQQNGHYVLREEKSSQLIALQSSVTDNDSAFARFLGHKVQASGTKSSDTFKVDRMAQVADMCGTGK
jgi:hypothetical protein